MIRKTPRPPPIRIPTDASSTSTLVGTPPRPRIRRQTTPERMAEREQWVFDQVQKVEDVISRAYVAVSDRVKAFFRGAR